jgi:regulator of cell morphogenesis and NO signaling
MKNELLLRINFDRLEWFPQLLQLGNTTLDEDIELDNIPESAHPIEDKLNDLKSFFIIHLKGKYDVNLCQAVVSSIIALEKDLKQNNRIRERILLPFERALTK